MPSFAPRLRHACAVSLAIAAALHLRGGGAGSPPTWAGNNGDVGDITKWLNATGIPGLSDAVVISSGTATVSSNKTYGSLTLSGGTISGGSNTLTLGTVSTSSWTGGSLNFSNSGGVAVSSGATLAIGGTGGTHDFVSTTLANSGTIAWTSGQLRTGSNGSIANNGTFTDTASDSVSNAFGGAQGSFSNAGTYNKNAAGTSTVGLTFANGGTVNVNSGTLALNGGGSNASGAKIKVASGAGLAFTGGSFTVGSGNDIVDSGGSYSVAGGNVTISSGTATMPTLAVSSGSLAFGSGGAMSNSVSVSGGTIGSGNYSIGKLTQSGGSISTAAVTVTGTGSSWTGGDMNGAGSLTIQNGADLSMATGTHDFSQRTITNNGSLNWSSGQLRTGSSGSIYNNGTFTDNASDSISNAFGGTQGMFANAGTYNKNGTGTTTIGLTFANNGNVNVNAGTLVLSGGGSSGATISTSSSATTNFAADYTLGHGATLTGNGRYSHTSGTLNIADNLSVSNLSEEGGTLAPAGTLTVGHFDLSNGTVGGASGGSVNVTNAMTWTGGTMNGAGTTTIGNGVSLTLSDATSSVRDFMGHSILNRGTVNWASADLRSGSGGTFTNDSGGSFNDTNAAGYHITNALGGSFTFTNNGAYVRHGSGATYVDAVFNNNGTVDVQQGDLELRGGGTTAAGGKMNSAANTNVYFRNSYTIANGGALAGSGTYWLTNGTLSAFGSLGAMFNQKSGILAGTNSILGTFTWSGGDWNLTAGDVSPTTTISAGALLNLSDADTTGRDFNGRGIVNYGNVAWGGGYLESGNGGSFLNASTGSFNDAHAAAYSINNPFGGSFTFTNNGAYTKNGAGTTTVGVAFVNNGTLAITKGEMIFNGTFTGQGTFALGNGAIARFANPVSFGSGTLVGRGTISAPSVTAGGLVSIGNSRGTLNIAGDFSLLSTSVLLIELAGTTQGTGYDFLNVSGNVTLGGQLNLKLLNGFQTTILPTDTFTILAAAGSNGLRGTFANVGNGQRLLTMDGFGSFQVNYANGLGSVTLSNFQAVPEPSTYALMALGVAVIGVAARRRVRRRG